MSKVTVGADPELWLQSTVDGKIVPSVGLLGGTKDKPIPIKKGMAKGFTLQEDNVSVEFNIPPAHNMEQFYNYITMALVNLREYVATKGAYTLCVKPEHKFFHKDLQTDQAQAFGCSADFNAYDKGNEFAKIKPKDLEDKQGAWRFAGGHVHVGFDADNVPHFVAAAFADYFIGLRFVGTDFQERRRALYGQPGRYRPTAYGIEYRTLSNFWLDGLIGDVGSAAFRLGYFLSNTPVSQIRAAYQKMPWGAVRDAIKNGDVKLSNNVNQYVMDEGLIPEADEL